MSALYHFARSDWLSAELSSPFYKITYRYLIKKPPSIELSLLIASVVDADEGASENERTPALTTLS